MAEFKTAEQYVVEKLEIMERERDEIELQHSAEILDLRNSLDAKSDELAEAYALLNIFRDFIEVRKSDYFGNCIEMNTIYGNNHPDFVARIMEYYDLSTEEDE